MYGYGSGSGSGGGYPHHGFGNTGASDVVDAYGEAPLPTYQTTPQLLLAANPGFGGAEANAHMPTPPPALRTYPTTVHAAHDYGYYHRGYYGYSYSCGFYRGEDGLLDEEAQAMIDAMFVTLVPSAVIGLATVVLLGCQAGVIRRRNHAGAAHRGVGGMRKNHAAGNFGMSTV